MSKWSLLLTIGLYLVLMTFIYLYNSAEGVSILTERGSTGTRDAYFTVVLY